MQRTLKYHVGRKTKQNLYNLVTNPIRAHPILFNLPDWTLVQDGNWVCDISDSGCGLMIHRRGDGYYGDTSIKESRVVSIWQYNFLSNTYSTFTSASLQILIE